ncbi:MAG: MBL fold metallo-hydrolase [Veillonellaceae bacterium]|nr:MBL fold metallo-hydrolase [Veillonellaceae bacterium]
MSEQVLPNIYRIEVPIPHSPLKATNAYVIRGNDRVLLVDSGQNRQESLTVLKQGLDELSVDLQQTDIFLTHMHADHSGLLTFLKTDSNRIFASQEDAGRVNQMLTADNPLEPLYQAAIRNGFSPEEAGKAITRHPGNVRGKLAALDFVFVKDNDVIQAGDYEFVCITTPGHTQGHACLYEPSRRFLISGDHILGDISPNITHFLGKGDPLADFLASLRKVSNLSVGTVLPGHRRIFNDCQGRICELQEHHRRRADEVAVILADRPMTGYQVAARMTWDMVYREWAEVAPAQKYFATGEALSHIHYLENRGYVRRLEQENVIYYYRS